MGLVREWLAESAVLAAARRVALRMFETNAAVGRTVFSGTEPYQVIGVAEDVDVGRIGDRIRGVVYTPLRIDPKWPLVLAARSAGDPGALTGALRSTLRRIDPDLPVTEIVTGEEIRNRETLFNRVASDIVVVLGLFALALALVGLSGLLAYLVAARRREIGVRMALGAGAARIKRMILFDGLRPVALGAAIGLALGTLLPRELVGTMRERGIDYMTLAIVPVVLLAVAWLACYVPACRATRVDPNVALREL